MADRHAFVCFCVDGPSEITALKNQFSELFDKIGGDDIDVDFRFAEFQRENHGDITTLKGVSPENVEKMIYKYYFKQQDKHSDLGWKDLTHIVHIIDLDGAYVQDSNVCLFTEAEKQLAAELSKKDHERTTLYYDDHIAVKDNPQWMCDRNKRKRQIIEHLLNIDELTIAKKTVKYEIYFFSSNLDHFLYGESNLSGRDKYQKAEGFNKMYPDGESIKAYFVGNSNCSDTDISQSWKRIRKNNNSLLRNSNVNILVNKIVNSSLEDWL